MDSSKDCHVNSDEDELDPRIQIELEILNNCTDLINKLEIELDEANTTFGILMKDSMRRLKVMTVKLGSCIEKARPYYNALEIARLAQVECQKAAKAFQRANEIHQAAKETVALAEARFISQKHEWEFDNAWQEMLNHATTKVTEAEYQKSESGREHQKRATLFNLAEQRVATLESKLKRNIIKARPYFEEKEVCQGQLDAQKMRIDQIQGELSKAKSDYAASLKRLEIISEEIHNQRRNKSGRVSPSPPVGPREPGVGAEINSFCKEESHPLEKAVGDSERKEDGDCDGSAGVTSWDIEREMERADLRSLGSVSMATSSALSDADDLDIDPIEEDLEELRQKVRELSVAESNKGDDWAQELTEAITRLDNAMFRKETNEELRALVRAKTPLSID
uniref:SH3 domain-binding protein 5 n=1 Tax=Lygus hesperus TaxID=30085 RepID=A0A0A9YH16_LYGHE